MFQKEAVVTSPTHACPKIWLIVFLSLFSKSLIG